MNDVAEIVIREATVDDSLDLFVWRNDEQTRLASVSQTPIALEDHSRWFDQSLRADDRLIYLAAHSTNHTQSIGMCRFDLSEDHGEAEVSINLNPQFRGQGLAGPVLRAAIRRFRRDIGSEVRIVATVRTDNVASARTFLSSGFRRTKSKDDFTYFEISAR